MSPFVALIPARMSSTRLPGKPLADIQGLPMVVHVANRARESGASRVVIATDAREILAVALAHRIEAVMTRADHPSGTDRLAQAAEELSLREDEIVVNVQGDEPLMPPALVSAVAQLLERRADCAIATAAHPIATMTEYLNPNAVKVVTDATGSAAYFSRAPIPFDRDRLQGLPGEVPPSFSAAMSANPPLRHIGIYAYRVSFLRAYPRLERAPAEILESLEQLRALWHGYRIAVLHADEAPPPGVDTAEDLERVRAVLATRAV
jgi:3-deoxy-manno-octulosonate cytidylyltransferase (CMP-KDO synthetase)